MGMRPAPVVGTLAIVIGLVAIFLNWNTPSWQPAFYIGALSVIGGLLLRIEAAITRAGCQDAPREDGRDSNA